MKRKLDENASAAHGLSLWLSSSHQNVNRKNLASIIKDNAHPGTAFEPHITLVSLPKATANNLEEVVAGLKKLAEEFKPFQVNTKDVEVGKTFYQSVYLPINPTEVLTKINARAAELFGKFREASNAPFFPHLSLFYGENTSDIVSKIQGQVKHFNLSNAPIAVDSIDVIELKGSVETWVQLGSLSLRDNLFFRSALFINNEWVAPVKKAYFDVVNPATREVFHKFPGGTKEDIDLAVAAAKNAFPSWSVTSPEVKAGYLRAIAAKIRERSLELAKLEVIDNGKAIEEAKADLDAVAQCFDYYGQQAIELGQKQDQEVRLPDQSYSCKIRFEPVGVAGMIVPWNYPLLMAAWKVAPCLAAGCTGVLKPSELTPITALELAAIIKEVNLPPGVMNVVSGFGPDAGQPLADHPDVEKIAFTGSVNTGSKVMTSGAQQIKKVSLELGGKSPLLVFEDTDVNQVVEWIMFGIFANQGQVCSATSRVLIQDKIYDKVMNKLLEETKKVKIGNGLDPATKLGPVVSEGQYNKVLEYIKKGQQEGAQLLCGGLPGKELSQGFFVPPTIFANVKDDMTIWKEEIFGPVLCVSKFATEENAIQIANNTTYGLAAAILSRDKARCERVAKALRAGIVWINCSQPTFVEAPWGGMKKSGTGRELGPWGLENYLEVKQVTSYNDPNGLGYEWYIKKT